MLGIGFFMFFGCTTQGLLRGLLEGEVEGRFGTDSKFASLVTFLKGKAPIYSGLDTRRFLALLLTCVLFVNAAFAGLNRNKSRYVGDGKRYSGAISRSSRHHRPDPSDIQLRTGQSSRQKKIYRRQL